MNDEIKTEEAWRPYEPKRIFIRPVPRKRIALFWTVEVVREGTVGPFDTVEAARAWATEWTTVRQVLIMPVLCPTGVAGMLAARFAKAGFTYPDDDEIPEPQEGGDA